MIFDNLPNPDLLGPDEKENALEKAARLNKGLKYEAELNEYYK